MRRSRCLLLCLALLSPGLFETLPAADAKAEVNRPRNILLIMADDLGIEGLGCYGGTDYRTPHLDRLASRGLRFTHAYSQPLCTPTRVELMTGKDNHRNWRCFGILPQDSRTFGHLMQERGYRTCIAGKWQLQSYDPPHFPSAEKRRGIGLHPKDAGFDSYALYHSLHTEDKGSRYANPTYLVDGTLREEVTGAYGEDLWVDHIARFMETHREEPMFIYYPMALPHWPMVPTPHSKAWNLPSRRLEEGTVHFPDMVAYMDHLVGRLVDTVDQLGLSEDTLILFYSDNGTDVKITSQMSGEAVPGGKATPTQRGIRVPFIAFWQNHIEPEVTDQLIDPSDFVPTLADLTGKPLSKEWATDGVSFAPRLLGEEGTPRDWAFFWYDPRPGWDKERFSRSIFALDHRYKLFTDGRFFDITGTGVRETPLDVESLTPEGQAARRKLRDVLDLKMQPPISPHARVEVDAFGNPL